MSDETKAGVVAIVWLVVFAIFAVEPTVIKALITIFVTIVELIYCKHDVEKEQLRKRDRNIRERASENFRRELENHTYTKDEIIGEWK
ncbi:MAG: hypothetical protein IKH78_08200 [Ruminococcus sp.]|uniref:hypothetical protein n=1 Tax=Ralstonia pseudosolanacearum TaxID=1310165 RepID=UPI003D169D18|nr:hypothetical protein [Ruminococcus sp.]